MANKPFSKLAAIGFVVDVFISVALPTTGFALLGRYLDKRWNATPWFSLVCLALALAISGLLVYRKARQYAEQAKTPKS